jgi:hypothetical protein
VLHMMLERDGVQVLLLIGEADPCRHHLTYPSRWKKWHTYPPRPLPEKPGILVEIDTVRVGIPNDRISLPSTALRFPSRSDSLAWDQMASWCRHHESAVENRKDRYRPIGSVLLRCGESISFLSSQ